MKVFDISSPSSPTLTGLISTVGDASKTDIYGNYLIVAEASMGIEIFDISSSSPVRVSYIFGINALSVKVNGNRLFVAVGTSGMRVYDISDPSSPSLINSVSSTTPYRDIDIDSHAFVASLTGGLRVLDPVSLSEVSSSSTYGPAIAIKKVGNLVLVMEDVAGLEIYDVSDPTSPVLQGFVPA